MTSEFRAGVLMIWLQPDTVITQFCFIPTFAKWHFLYKLGNKEISLFKFTIYFTRKKCFCSRLILMVKALDEPCMVNREKAPH